LKIAGYKENLFSNLSGIGKKVLEVGVGTGPNFKYYANNSNLSITGVDPNKQMEKYARSSATTAGLPLSNFNFLRGVQVFWLFGTSALCNWHFNEIIGKTFQIFFLRICLSA
jgi:ubiquinone/menaquinone biosynthesis C-methylase UbiE